MKLNYNLYIGSNPNPKDTNNIVVNGELKNNRLVSIDSMKIGDRELISSNGGDTDMGIPSIEYNIHTYFSGWGKIVEKGAALFVQYGMSGVSPSEQVPALFSKLHTGIEMSGYGNQLEIDDGNELLYPTKNTYYQAQKVLDEMFAAGASEFITLEDVGISYPSPAVENLDISESTRIFGFNLTCTDDIKLLPTVIIDGVEYLCKLLYDSDFYGEVTDVTYYKKSDIALDEEGYKTFVVSQDSIEGFLGCWVGTLGE